MKNISASSQKPSMGKGRAILIALACIIALTVVSVVGFKTMDHRRELRYAIQSRDHVALEKLLKAHPGLANADLPNRSPNDKWSPLHMAACVSDPETIEILAKHRAKINAQDSSGLTPLHYTVAQGRYDSAHMLINKGADMNAKGRDGRTPLDLAKNLRDQPLIEMFRIRGAKE